MLPNFIKNLKLQLVHNRNLYFFLIVWFVINLIQSAFTELAHDEAYYWMYSRYLDWGYFDHPPMIAVLIKFGYSLFKNELGVRLLTSVMGTFTLFMLYQLIEVNRNLKVFIMLCVSIVLMHSHIAGFLAIPDLPVIFFATLFFILIKKYIEKDNMITALLIGITSALMLYSKYHGILILTFTFSAHIKFIKRKSFWIIPLVLIVLMIPHLSWQIENHFPSFQYHLYTRSSIYKIGYTWNYIYSQLLIAGPLVSILIFYNAFTVKAENIFNRILKFNLTGIYLFFLLMSFKGRVEAHWTAIAFIPLIVLSYKKIIESKQSIFWLKALFIPSIIGFIFIRIWMVYEIIPAKINPAKELHNWDKWAYEIDSLSNDRKVVFVNSFQRPSKFCFYTGAEFSHSLNNIYYRKNQYDIWNFENILQHDSVFLVSSRTPDDSIITVVGEKYRFEYIDNFKSYCNLIIEIPGIKSIRAKPGEKKILHLNIINPRNQDISFSNGDKIVATFHDGKKYLKRGTLMQLNDIFIPAMGSKKFMVDLEMPLKSDEYSLYISIMTRNQSPALNANLIGVSVE
ncbi:MAG: glycosyltransferase family 39 protein [Bacteroidales bacterium]|nr:glycosyltransferase family 39 protein [Bacteroidales bacterium]